MQMGNVYVNLIIIGKEHSSFINSDDENKPSVQRENEKPQTGRKYVQTT